MRVYLGQTGSLTFYSICQFDNNLTPNNKKSNFMSYVFCHSANFGNSVSYNETTDYCYSELIIKVLREYLK